MVFSFLIANVFCVAVFFQGGVWWCFSVRCVMAGTALCGGISTRQNTHLLVGRGVVRLRRTAVAHLLMDWCEKLDLSHRVTTQFNLNALYATPHHTAKSHSP